MMHLDADDRRVLGVVAIRAASFFVGGVGIAASLGLSWRVLAWAAGF